MVLQAASKKPVCSLFFYQLACTILIPCNKNGHKYGQIISWQQKCTQAETAGGLKSILGSGVRGGLNYTATDTLTCNPSLSSSFIESTICRALQSLQYIELELTSGPTTYPHRCHLAEVSLPRHLYLATNFSSMESTCHAG